MDISAFIAQLEAKGYTVSPTNSLVYVGHNDQWMLPATLPGTATQTTIPSGGYAVQLSTQALTGPSTSSSTRAPRADVGYYVPSGWGSWWRSARDRAKEGSGKARIAIIGDSVARGYYSSNLESAGGAQLLRSSLQAFYGDGGSGFKTATDSNTFANAKGVDASAATYYASHGYITKGGTWSLYSGPTGPGFAYGLSTTDSATPGNATFSVRGTIATIYTISNNGANANWSYQIDGGAVVNVTDAPVGNTMQLTQVTGLAAGSHTVKIIYNDAGTKTLYVAGVSGENATGIIVNNHSIFGIRSSDLSFSLYGDATSPSDWMGGYKYPADLAIWSLGLNDAGSNVTGDAYAKTLRRWMQQVRDGGTLTGTTDILIVLPHAGTLDSTNYLYQDYCLRAREIAATFGAAVIDLWALGRNSWNYWNSLGYWCNSATPGNVGTNSVHPSDVGHEYIASVVGSIITN